VPLLDEHCPEAVGRRVALHHEPLGEVGHGEDRRCGDCGLESLESRCGLLAPREAILFEESSQRRRNVDELAIVAG
jgi:hypothetical protein